MKVISIKLTDEEYKELEERARREGFVLISDYVRYLLFSPQPSRNSANTASINVDEIVNQISTKIERKVQDLINPFTAQIEDLKKKYAELLEKIEELGSKTETKNESVEEKPSKTVKREGGEKKTAIDILNEQGAVYESELKLKNADAFFAKLEREGARIIYTEKERIAVSQDFYNRFVEKLKEIKTSDPEEAQSKLDPKEAKLFRKLVSEGTIIFDGESKSWKVLV